MRARGPLPGDASFIFRSGLTANLVVAVAEYRGIGYQDMHRRVTSRRAYINTLVGSAKLG